MGKGRTGDEGWGADEERRKSVRIEGEEEGVGDEEEGLMSSAEIGEDE